MFKALVIRDSHVGTVFLIQMIVIHKHCNVSGVHIHKSGPTDPAQILIIWILFHNFSVFCYKFTANKHFDSTGICLVGLQK